MVEHIENFDSISSTKEALSSLAPKVFVLDYFDPDPAPSSNRNKHRKASRAELFGEEVSLLLASATKFDTVLINLQSPGGAVSEFGLAASHLLRLKKAGIRTVVTVDKVAASGGFMMACCADEIVAAPFSFIGSIGVVAEMPNISKVLSKNDVDWNMFTAGKFKRTITVFSANTEEGKEKFQAEIESIHNAFKNHVQANRGDVLDIEQVATGEAWLAVQCKEHGLVDRLATSLDVMQDYSDKGYDVIKVSRREPKKDPFHNLFHRSVSFGEELVDRVSERLWANVVTLPSSSSSSTAAAAAVGSVSARDNVAAMSPHAAASRAKF
jgi:serine protease SohB